jgi:hypothetical protein
MKDLSFEELFSLSPGTKIKMTTNYPSDVVTRKIIEIEKINDYGLYYIDNIDDLLPIRYPKFSLAKDMKAHFVIFSLVNKLDIRNYL